MTKSTQVKPKTSYQKVGYIGSGKFFGEYEALEDLPYNHSLLCKSLDTEVLVISKDDFVKKISAI